MQTCPWAKPRARNEEGGETQLVDGQLQGLQPSPSTGQQDGRCHYPRSMLDCVPWVLSEALDPLAAYPKPRYLPGHLCALRSGVVPS